MKTKIKKTCLLFLLIISTFTICGLKNVEMNKINKVYIVYLNGKKLGLIKNKKELLNLIDKNNEKIKTQYNVDKVYPPSGLKIEQYNTFDNNILTEKEIYQKILDKSSFTIKGYQIQITPNKGKTKYINVLNKDDIEPALTGAVEAFIPKSNLTAYINGNQVEIKDTGRTIENVYFDERITYKEAYLNVDDILITNKNDLKKYLLFGTLQKQDEYVVKDGDTIEKIADNNKLATEELLIANPSLASANSLLSEGQILNVGAINPMFNVVEESEIKELVETNFDTITETDDTKYENQTTVKQEGKKGLNKVTEKVQYKNGVITNLVVTNQQQISKSVPKIVVKGTKKAYSYGGWSYSGSYIPALSNSNFGWPTVSPYIVTSEFKWRWGKHHDGIDISGCGMGSPIFAIAPGKVTQTVSNCPANGTYGSSCGGGYGNVVYIDHGNGMIVKYAHLASVKVSVGQTISQGQVVGTMGNSGSSTGTHLHFEVRINGTAINPRSLY